MPAQYYRALSLKENGKIELQQQTNPQFFKPSDMDFSGVRVRVWTSCPIIHKKINLITLPPWSLFTVSADWRRLAMKCPLVVKWSLGSRDIGRQAQHRTARHSLPQLATVDQKPRQMASKQTAPISIWSGLNKMPGGERSVE